MEPFLPEINHHLGLTAIFFSFTLEVHLQFRSIMILLDHQGGGLQSRLPEFSFLQHCQEVEGASPFLSVIPIF